ncbi:MAG: transglutaminase family protein, partial [Alphaproteobacteria bacterium]|nr:transglutaminase family protein [Alphaproteobacteria bacterium]
AAFLAGVDRTPRRTIDVLVALNQRLQREIAYVIRMEPGVQTPDATLRLAKGSCRDSAWLFVHILRHLGFAARFVSGYLIQLVADEKSLDGPSGPSADFTDLHAWTEVYLPGAGWIGLDPTSGLMAGEGHIPLASGPEPTAAAPIEGGHEKAEVAFAVSMSVTRVRETPRVTKPYTEPQWERIQAVGQEVDARLRAGDVRLTMGGEPTFVSLDDRDGAEWTIAALGPTKRRLAGGLLRRLARRFATGPLLHYGQGKWYPGEQLPRWALGCHWRRDGEPIWQDQALLASDESKGNAGPEQAKAFIEALAERLAVEPRWATPGYEDMFYYIWRERRLPVNVDVKDSRVEDPLERARIARVFEQGLSHIVGYCLPLIADGPPNGPSGRRWRSGPWFFRPETMYLIPGDSPMGLRLPLDSLPWTAAADVETALERDPMQAALPLPPYAWLRDGRAAAQPLLQDRRPALSGNGPGGGNGARDTGARRKPAKLDSRPGRNESAAWLARTALCVEPRGGLLTVFMPPVSLAEDYLDLVAAVEDTARKLAQPVIVEGYTPPFDQRLQRFEITPDPGVIEVNIHPAESWDELVARTQIVYEEARQSRLVAEKFNLDGRHVGTGGGNHFVLGGRTPADSPFLRRPDLLASLVAYWHNHPSLSYCFSGQFIGPTSQHPRVDEARNDAVYELETAIKQVTAQRDPPHPPPPWMTDRIFRNILVDVTGNTHRAEFSIDKLYSPDGPSGRRGLLELRAFEMPPHQRMSCAQQLLMRALVAAFWERPYDKPLVRWNTRLHDTFMLPHFVREDLAEIVADLAARGFALDPAWFAPHWEFRFPPIGEAAFAGVHLELRNALEPWHVLGEESAAGGTARYVDSSVERIEVKLANLVGERHVLACNGIKVPLHPTGIEGEYVAGIRFKAWNPPSALHPTIPPHAPLVIDLVDAWSARAIGGCTYHVAHPGGRAHDRFPINANEAEARRRARFFPIGHTPGTSVPVAPTPASEYPLTLDLRRG